MAGLLTDEATSGPAAQDPPVRQRSAPGRKRRQIIGPRVATAMAITGRILIVAGLLLLSFAVFQLWGTGLEEAGHQDDLGSELFKEIPKTQRSGGNDTNSVAAVAERLAKSEPADPAQMAAIQEGQAAGAIVIPKIGLAKFFVEGTAKTDLKKGPGHYAGTPYPGQPGNAAIAGHRTTYGAPFNRIDELAPGDTIETTTIQGKFIYEVVAPPQQGIEEGPGWFTVRPNQGAVVSTLPEGGNWLTLTACHPKYSAKQRIVVRARLVTEQPAPIVAPPVTPGDATNAPASTVKNTAEISNFDEDLGWHPEFLLPSIALGLGCAAIALVAWLIGRRWKRWPAYLLATPLFLVVLWFCFANVDRFIPSF